MKRTFCSTIVRAPILYLLALLPLVVGCADMSRLDAVPRDMKDDVTVLGMKDVRYWGDETTTKLVDDAVQSYQREVAALRASGGTGDVPQAQFLAISGGGEDGAFGAGLLVGWTATGTRPTFKLVTGISTGALTAPFAFLGSAYDKKLQEVYTTLAAKDVMQPRGYTAVLFEDALADNSPLRKNRRQIFRSRDARSRRRGRCQGTHAAHRHDQS